MELSCAAQHFHRHRHDGVAWLGLAPTRTAAAAGALFSTTTRAAQMLSISVWDALASLWPIIKVLAVIAVVVTVRLLSILPGRQKRPSKKRSPSETCSTALFLGSGGHTTELLLLLRSLNPQRYTPRSYFVSSGDDFSRKKAIAFEQEWAEGGATAASTSYTIVTLPRARAVHQSWLSTPISTALCFIECARHFVLPQISRRAASSRPPELVIMNGPGTCVPLVAAIYVNRVSIHARSSPAS